MTWDVLFFKTKPSNFTTMKLSDDLMESTVLSSGVITAILPNLDIKKPSHVILNGEISPSESSPDLQSTNDYEVSEEPLGTIKSVRIITIGAGLSGINMAQKAKHYLKNAEHVIYEKNPGIGGTWYENIYKGCKCDIRKPIFLQFLDQGLTKEQHLIITNLRGSQTQIGNLCFLLKMKFASIFSTVSTSTSSMNVSRWTTKSLALLGRRSAGSGMSRFGTMSTKS
jgi:hypothetical protein